MCVCVDIIFNLSSVRLVHKFCHRIKKKWRKKQILSVNLQSESHAKVEVHEKKNLKKHVVVVAIYSSWRQFRTHSFVHELKCHVKLHWMVRYCMWLCVLYIQNTKHALFCLFLILFFVTTLFHCRHFSLRSSLSSIHT